MFDRTPRSGALRLRAVLQRIADAEGRLLESTGDLQEFVDELTERGVITREGHRFRIRWGSSLFN